MNKESLKIKYIIGSHIDGPDYPNEEDFFYLIRKWYHTEGGADWIHNGRGIPDEGKIVFIEHMFAEFAGKEYQEKCDKLIEDLMKKGIISVIKETKHSRYFQIDRETY